ncbi:MAG: GNAT family N-acetyltransferase [Planctomycetota bacterium]
MSFEVRRLTAEDAVRYGGVRARMLREHPASYVSSPDEVSGKSDDELRAFLFSRNSGEADFILGAFEAGELIGTSGLFRYAQPKRRHLAEIWGVWTHPEARRRGIARALVTETMERGRVVSGITHLRIGASASNEGAAKLYRSLGFATWGVEPASLQLETGEVHGEIHMSLAL